MWNTTLRGCGVRIHIRKKTYRKCLIMVLDHLTTLFKDNSLLTLTSRLKGWLIQTYVLEPLSLGCLSRGKLWWNSCQGTMVEWWRFNYWNIIMDTIQEIVDNQMKELTTKEEVLCLSFKQKLKEQYGNNEEFLRNIYGCNNNWERNYE